MTVYYSLLLRALGCVARVGKAMHNAKQCHDLGLEAAHRFLESARTKYLHISSAARCC